MPSLAVNYLCGECDGEIDQRYDWYCRSCAQWRCAQCGPCSAGINAWDYRPSRFRSKGNYRRDALMGVELEVGGSRCAIPRVVKQFDDCEQHLYMKDDGSISGVEIVTHPMTLAWARCFPFADLLRDLRGADCYVNNEYGLHIHVSRNAFRRNGKQSASHQMLWLLFIYRNVAELEKLARRPESRWAKFRTPGPGELANKAKAVQREDRYLAVNCNNKKTYELRFFASTLNEQEFYAALEFADASVRYTRSIAIKDVLRGKAITWRDFTAWVKRHNYKNLAAELSR